jgi:hypothetical protein
VEEEGVSEGIGFRLVMESLVMAIIALGIVLLVDWRLWIVAPGRWEES